MLRPSLTDAVEKVGGESLMPVCWLDLASVGWSGLSAVAHAGLGLDAHATNW